MTENLLRQYDILMVLLLCENKTTFTLPVFGIRHLSGLDILKHAHILRNSAFSSIQMAMWPNYKIIQTYAVLNLITWANNR